MMRFFLVTGSKDTRIKIWNRRDYLVERDDGKIIILPAYRELRCLRGHVAAVNVVRIFQHTLASGGGDRVIHLWDLRTGQMLRSLRGHVTGVVCLQYTGNLIISGSSDKTARIFDLERPDEEVQIACLEGHEGIVRALQVQKSEMEAKVLLQIVTGSYDGTVKIWHPDDGDSSCWRPHLTLSVQEDTTGDENRVFNVQCDERRLVCCSQNSIVLWDFGLDEQDISSGEVDSVRRGGEV
ncbi:uncharacterized protein RCC_12280 [Ramularia collo-cygni]|uniref:Uncharacterized protein n=1 Tax=Ramularia collo-cygni TaxID=112498 RepID=A0A2D3ULK1_9PEZI|nr:uncharacterized protein RCC_12280 [Ramularia collo-cygni]CZT15032.1 uncharacterized protein RCC_12280 [Ramularia collo-cygni]